MHNNAMNKQEKSLTAAVILAIIAAFVAVILDNSVLVAAVNVMLVTALVTFTYLYVKHTKELVEKTEQQKQVMIDSQINAVTPLIELRLTYSELPSLGKRTQVEYRNVGKGPALQLRFWIEFGEGCLYRTKAFLLQVVPSDFEWRSSGIIKAEIQGEWISTVTPLIRAQYQGIFGHQKTYESLLVFPSNTPPILEFGETTDVICINTLRWVEPGDIEPLNRAC